jgi:FKBP-type peptidyl-prolyl cis-trans isomerase
MNTKKRILISLKAALAVLFVLVLSGCSGSLGKPAPGALDKDTSYAMGMYMAMVMVNQGVGGIHYDYQAFAEGFKALIEEEETRLSMEEAGLKVQAVFAEILAKQMPPQEEELSPEEAEAFRVESEKNRLEGEAFLAENGRKSGVVTTSTGLQYEVISQGTGAKPAATDVILIDYEGTLLDGTVFDSSYERGEPLQYPLNGLIPGWIEGLQLMSEGSTYRFFIPSDLAYGEDGYGPIPPNTTLIFKVELLSIVK